MSIANISAKNLQRAAKIRGQIDRLEAQMQKILGGSSSGGASNGSPKRRRRKMSAAARAKIAAAQRRRWKAQKAAQAG